MIDRKVMYMAHPVAPTEEEIAATPSHTPFTGHDMEGGGRPYTKSTRAKMATLENAARAGRWLQWLRKSFPETTFIAPWMVGILTGDDDSDPAQRERGLLDACCTIERCDGIVLCGGRISSGMRREMEHGQRSNFVKFKPDPDPFVGGVIDLKPLYFEVYDLTGLGAEPPLGRACDSCYAPTTLAKWMVPK